MKSDTGGTQQSFRVVTVARVECNADAGATVDCLAVQLVGLIERFENIFGHKVYAEDTIAGFDGNLELTATDAGNDLVFRENGAHPVRSFQEDLVAHLVSQAVVDLLQVDQAQGHQREFILMTFGPLYGQRKQFEE